VGEGEGWEGTGKEVRETVKQKDPIDEEDKWRESPLGRGLHARDEEREPDERPEEGAQRQPTLPQLAQRAPAGYKPPEKIIGKEHRPSP